MSHKTAGVIVSLLLSIPACPQKIDTILYGASYYHEYMPYERLDQDVRLMQKAGISVVRVGESTWSCWEPRDGRFEFAWMDRTLDRLRQAGIRVIMGTPTYSIPPWLYKKHPEILAVRLGGQKAVYGIRQNMDISHPAYRFHCERVIRQIASRYKDRRTLLAEITLDPPASTQDFAGPPILDDDYLVLSTIHSAKGLEWDAVFVIHASDGNIPSDMSTGSPEQVEEELRLFYVALTRAKNRLYVCYPLRYYRYAQGFSDRYGYAQLTRFLPKRVAGHFRRCTSLGLDGEDTPDETGGLQGRTTSKSVRRRTKNLWS